jgi:Cu2+-exporting ATPase
VTDRVGEGVPEPGGQSSRKGGTRVYLADESCVRCVFTLGDRLRPGASRLIAELAAQGIPVSILSGDHEGAVQEVARELGIEDAAGGLRPAQKLARLQALQEAGEVVAMVGDGVNDAPVLAQAHVSIAMGGGTQVARASADMILLNEQLPVLAAGVRKARMALRVIRQNLLWAISYNLLALPAAALGYVAPWMAAIGMSLSSLLVVLNATRLSGRRSAPAVQAEVR